MLSRCLVKPRNSCILWGKRTRWLRRAGEPPCPKAGGLISAGSPAARPAAAGTQLGGRRRRAGRSPAPRPASGAAPAAMEPLPTGHRLPAPGSGGGLRAERTPAPRIPPGGGAGRIRVGSGAPPAPASPGRGNARRGDLHALAHRAGTRARVRAHPSPQQRAVRCRFPCSACASRHARAVGTRMPGLRAPGALQDFGG